MPGTPAIVVIADVGDGLFHVGDEAMLVANLAAGVAVGKLGTSSVTVDEIRAAQ